MRFATIVEGGRSAVAAVDDRGILPLVIPDPGFDSLRGIAAAGAGALARVAAWVAEQPDQRYRAIDEVELGPAVPDPGAIYTIGLNYPAPGAPDDARPERPLVYAKLPTSVTGHRSVVTWDRSLTLNVDAEVELGVVVGEAITGPVTPAGAMGHVFGYTCVNDVSSRDPWLDGDQWLLGKSMAGFCPVGPWVVTADEVDPGDLRLACAIDGEPIQDDRTARMRFSIPEVISYLSHHTVLRPGDLVATGTPARLAAPPGPDRHLEVGDRVTVWIERIGELAITIA